MTNKIFYIFSAIIISLALFLRLYKIENRAPFDWDQNRDYAVISSITSGKPVLIGPVAKGEGGFFLGPLYYYLVVPTYKLMGGSPVSLPITSAILDVLAIVLIIIFLRKSLGDFSTLVLAFVWCISWFAIEASRVSWNVALLQIWIVTFIYLIQAKLSSIKALFFGLVLGLTWHIHASLIPLSLLASIFFIRHLGLNLKKILLVALGYTIALSPLIIFDLRHSGLERHLIYQFFVASESVTYPFAKVFVSVFSRFGKNTIAILTGTSDLHLSWGLTGAALAFISLFSKFKLLRISGAIILSNLALTLYLGEPGFPEYYLAASYIPLLIIILNLLVSTKKFILPLSLTLLLVFSYLNLSKFNVNSTSFSLFQKQSTVQEISKISHNIDIRYDLPFGRESGIPAMLEKSGVNVSNTAKTQVVITESDAESIFIDGEIAKDIGRFGGLRVGYHVVQ